MVDAIPTQSHGVVMAMKGFPVPLLSSSTSYHLMSSAPSTGDPRKVSSHVHMPGKNKWTIPVSFHGGNAADNKPSF